MWRWHDGEWTAPVAAVRAAVDTEHTVNIAGSVLHLSESIVLCRGPLVWLCTTLHSDHTFLLTFAYACMKDSDTASNSGSCLPSGGWWVGGGGGNHNAAWCFVSHHLFSRPPAWQIRRWREATTQKRKQTIQQMAANHFIRHSRKRKNNLSSRLFQCKSRTDRCI